MNAHILNRKNSKRYPQKCTNPALLLAKCSNIHLNENSRNNSILNERGTRWCWNVPCAYDMVKTQIGQTKEINANDRLRLAK